jgi:PAS domain S-box-containing protein
MVDQEGVADPMAVLEGLLQHALQDVTERRAAEEALRQAMALSAKRERELAHLSRLYAALSKINQAIVRTPTRDELFQTICRVLAEEGGLRMIWIGWHDPVTERLVPVADYGDERGYPRDLEVYADERPEGRGPTGIAFRSGLPYVCNDILADPSTLPWRTELERCGFRASAAFPIREQGVVSGTLAVYSEEPGFFREREMALLAEATDNISFALDNMARDEDRRSAERQVRRERDFSEAVLNSLPGILYLYAKDGTFLRWNRNFERVTGYDGAALATMRPLDVIAVPDKDRVEARIEEVFAKGESDVEAGILSRDGTVTPFYLTGITTPIDGRTCLVGVGIDITERKRAEEARWESEARYRTLFEWAPDGIIIADSRGTYLDANASICQLLGYRRDELIGMNAADIVLADELANIEPALAAITARTGYHREWTFRRKDGTTVAAEVIATLMPDGNLLALFRDITERKEAERALRELNETLEVKVATRTEELRAAVVRAEAADRLKSAFLATMSHELRTPLNSIIGFTGIVLQGLAGPLTAEQTKQLGMVRGSARHLLELINDVLDLSKIEANQLEVRLERFDLRKSLERVVAMVTPMAAKKGLALTATLSPALGEMVSDRRRVEQILLNLLSNAIKFTDRGEVTLSAAIDESARPPALQLQVTDTGIGLKPEDLATLFQPFRQIDSGLTRQHEGTGLGLAICRRLAGLLQGEIASASEWSKGSQFTVTLPLERSAAA